MYDINSLSDLINSLSNNTSISLESSSPDELASLMRLTGFINVIINKNIVTGTKPEYAGESVTLLGNIIDDDDLLDEEDKQKPIVNQDCQVKKKACKDCSCGRAKEEEEQEAKEQETKQNMKSSCGNCYLGDAFRCGGCPYLGMPAFKPGERVTISMQDDI